jgi:PTH1 family peptidyl-tRNA hydrolase
MDLRIIVGLGNPGRKYRHNRHNIGFQAVDGLAKKFGIRLWRKSCKAQIGRGEISGAPIILAKPQTFMNRSGESVALMCSRYKIFTGSLIVIHDDLDLEAGRIKLKKGGGHGGHNGLRSIMERCGDSEFVRIRIGIGRPQGGEEASEYVLKNFSDPAEARQGVEEVGDIVEFLLLNGLSEAMHRFHS